MTPQEAKEELMQNNLILAHKMDLAKSKKEKEIINKKYCANLAAISALEKQIPNSVVLEADGYDDKGELIYDIAYCPNCNSRFDLGYDDEAKCCPVCGQALDWSN